MYLAYREWLEYQRVPLTTLILQFEAKKYRYAAHTVEAPNPKFDLILQP